MHFDFEYRKSAEQRCIQLAMGIAPGRYLSVESSSGMFGAHPIVQLKKDSGHAIAVTCSNGGHRIERAQPAE
jgi:hypothetical protein